MVGSASTTVVYTSQASAVLRNASRNAVHDADAQDRYDRIIEARFPPYTISSSRPYEINAGGAHIRDSLGGCAYTLEFERYIKHSLPRSVAAARRLWIEWWRVPYVLERVTALLGKPMLESVLLLVQHRLHPREVERRSRHTLRTISRARSQALRLVRRLMPHEYYDRPSLLAEALGLT